MNTKENNVAKSDPEEVGFFLALQLVVFRSLKYCQQAAADNALGHAAAFSAEIIASSFFFFFFQQDLKTKQKQRADNNGNVCNLI